MSAAVRGLRQLGRTLLPVLVVGSLCSACSHDRYIVPPEVVGTLRAPLNESTRVRWVLYLTDGGRVYPISFAEAGAPHFTPARPPHTQQYQAACVLRSADVTRNSARYYIEVIGSAGGASCISFKSYPIVGGPEGGVAFVSSEVLDTVPFDQERISFINGPRATTSSAGDGTVNEFAAAHPEPHLIVTVRWYNEHSGRYSLPPAFKDNRPPESPLDRQ